MQLKTVHKPCDESERKRLGTNEGGNAVGGVRECLFSDYYYPKHDIVLVLVDGSIIPLQSVSLNMIVCFATVFLSETLVKTC